MSKYFWRAYYTIFPPTTIGDALIYAARCKNEKKVPYMWYNKRGRFYDIILEKTMCVHYSTTLNVEAGVDDSGKIVNIKINEEDLYFKKDTAKS